MDTKRIDATISLLEKIRDNNLPFNMEDPNRKICLEGWMGRRVEDIASYLGISINEAEGLTGYTMFSYDEYWEFYQGKALKEICPQDLIRERYKYK